MRAFNRTGGMGGTGGSASWDRNISGLMITSQDNKATIRWTDPTSEDWAQTALVRKIGSMPEGIDDGALVMTSTVRDQYATSGYVDTGLPDGETVYYKLFPARILNGRPAYTNNIINGGSVAIAYILPDPLIAFSITAGDSAVTVSRILPENAEGADITYKAGGIPANMDDGTRIANVLDGQLISGLVNGTEYGFRAAAFNEFGRFSASAGDKTATAEPYEIIPSPVTNFAASAGNGEVTLSFAMPSDATSVTIAYKQDSAPEDMDDGTVITGAESGLIIENLTNDETYYFRAATHNQYGRTNDDTAGQVVSATPVSATIWGVRRLITSSDPAWERTDAAASYPEPVAAIGNSAGSSPFDGARPWETRMCNIVNGEVTAYQNDPGFSFAPANGDVMVEIPLSYFKRWQADGYEYIQISDGMPDATWQPMALHDRPGGVKDKAYVGRYLTSGSQNAQVSRSGISPLNSMTRAEFRTGARAKSAAWSQWDYMTLATIQLLFLVEWASYNSQAKVGLGWVNQGSAPMAGNTDTMIYHTGRQGADGTTAIQYRWIENIWGGIYQFVDGININNRQPYINNNPAQWADDTATNYAQIGYSCPTSSNWQSRLGMDNNNQFAMLPTVVGGSDSTYIPDYYYQGSGWRVAFCGGAWDDGTNAGLWFWAASGTSSRADSYVGSRLLFLP